MNNKRRRDHNFYDCDGRHRSIANSSEVDCKVAKTTECRYLGYNYSKVLLPLAGARPKLAFMERNSFAIPYMSNYCTIVDVSVFALDGQESYA